MTQFQHTLRQLLTGEKTETSRIALPEPDGTGSFDCEAIRYPDGSKAVQRYLVGWQKWRTVWVEGQNYAIVPRRGQKSVGRFKVESIWRQDVRTLTLGQVRAEGFLNNAEFLSVWCKMHDSKFQPVAAQGWMYLEHRPAERYQAWRMTIKVLWETVNWNAPAVAALHIEPKVLD